MFESLLPSELSRIAVEASIYAELNTSMEFSRSTGPCVTCAARTGTRRVPESFLASFCATGLEWPDLDGTLDVALVRGTESVSFWARMLSNFPGLVRKSAETSVSVAVRTNCRA
jgi:hypothetical protein